MSRLVNRRAVLRAVGVAAVAGPLVTQRSSVRASDFLAPGVSHTKALQQALDKPGADVVIIDNYYVGVVFATGNLLRTSRPISIRFERVRVGKHVHATSSSIRWHGSAEGGPGGAVEFHDCLITTSPSTASLLSQAGRRSRSARPRG